MNGLPGRGAERPGIRVGHPVVKQYVVANRSGADLHRVTVTDPAAPGRSLTCPGGPRFWMRGMTSVVCTSRVPAAPGRHTTTARVRGEIPSLGLRPTATAVTGYRGVGGALALAVTVTVRNGPAPSAVLRYEVSNPGNVPVYGARLTDPLLPPRTRLDCAGRSAPPAVLAPGARAVCSARLTGLRPGTYRSRPVVRGTDRLVTLGPAGERVAPPGLVARASVPFTVRRVAAPRAPGAAPGPGQAAPGAGAPGAGGLPGAVPGAGPAAGTAPGAAAPGTAPGAVAPGAVAPGAAGPPGAAAAPAAAAAPGAAAPGAAAGAGAAAPGAAAPGAA
ncbi:hypothetical protein ACISUF_26545, partial [Streptomyces sp. NPDC003090]